MKRLAPLLLLAACSAPAQDEPEPTPVPFVIDEIPLTGFVDPFIGTGGSGNAIPGALVPHGFVRLTPDTKGNAGDVGGYAWEDPELEGFVHTQLEGPGGSANGYSQLLVLPQTGALETHREQRVAPFSHDHEQAHPGYYRVELDSGVVAELTATGHAGVHRYTFPAGSGRLLLDLGHSKGDSTGGSVSLDGRSWSGFASYNVHPVLSLLDGGAGGMAMMTSYFHAELSRAPQDTGVFRGAGDQPSEQPGERQAIGSWIGMWAGWDFAEETTVELRVGVSLISADQARANLEAEVGDESFDAVAQRAEARWNSKLNRMQVEGSDTVKTKFYTALYHSMFQPADHTEADGRYVVSASGVPEVVSDGIPHYYSDDWCMWDTFRTLHPLGTILEPELRGDITRSLLEVYRLGGWLPKCTWSATGYSRVMIGNPAVPIIADAWVKGLDTGDAALAWEAVDHAGTAELPNLSDGTCGYLNLGTVPDYLELGYVPTECDPSQSVSMTLEHSYDDWAAARMAEALGRTADAQRYDERGTWWRNHWNAEAGFMQARDRSGAWVEPFDPDDGSDFNNFCEATAHIYSWFVPHDVPALVEVMGGTDAFVQRLDAFFADGHFQPSNQPSFHIPWLYAAAGRPAGTQQRVRAIVDEVFTDQPDGLPGNDDAGSTSAYLVLSMLGLYPLAPGDGAYTISAPRLSGGTLYLHPGYYDGGRVNIEVVGDPEVEPYLASVEWNGEELDELRIGHDQLVAGGTLRFTLAAEPQ